MKQAQQMMSVMAAKITTLEQQLQSVQLRTATANAQQRLKLPKPPETNGTTPSAINWCYKMETYLQAQNTDLNLPSTVTYAASFLKDSALNWWLRYQQEVAAGKRQPFANWAAFKQEFIDTFTPVKPDYNARNKLDRLSQTRSVFDYASHYNTLMLELPNMDEADRVHFFIKGLKPEIRMHVTLHTPATLHEAVELAIQADGLLWGMHKGRKPPSYVPRPNFPVQRQPMDPGPTPMELGSMEQENVGQAEFHLVEGRRKPLRCFYCHRAGHRIADCYQRKSDEEKQRGSQPFKLPAQQQQQQRPPFKGKGGKPPNRRSTN
uniref:Ty3 transposon capsid-like protein domain-containing protein n=1 Tax=Tetradesmus obliquus TaxID=3088 RepID=A0A383WFM0_TETOB